MATIDGRCNVAFCWDHNGAHKCELLRGHGGPCRGDGMRGWTDEDRAAVDAWICVQDAFDELVERGFAREAVAHLILFQAVNFLARNLKWCPTDVRAAAREAADKWGIKWAEQRARAGLPSSPCQCGRESCRMRGGTEEAHGTR